jgi:hypothetical protein
MFTCAGNAIGVRPEGGKPGTHGRPNGKIEAGHVYLPKDAPRLGEFLSELLALPNGRHDDQVASVSQFLFWWQRENFPIPPADRSAILCLSAERDFPGYRWPLVAKARQCQAGVERRLRKCSGIGSLRSELSELGGRHSAVPPRERIPPAPVFSGEGRRSLASA